MRKYLEAEDIQLVFSGTNYFELLEQLIDGSREVLHLQTYIFDADTTGMKIVESLKRAVARGVKVFVLCDAYGSFHINPELQKEFSHLNIHFRRYSPLLSSESIFFGRRLHHKIAVADKHVGLIGGINIANKYNFIGQEEAWLDYAVLVKGRVCEYLDLLCEQVYRKRRRYKLKAWENRMLKEQLPATQKLIRFRRNDFIQQSDEIHHSYVESIKKAKQSIVIVASYFLPGINFRRLLRQAASRGVKIRIILAGKSDVNSVKLAQHYLYTFYLNNNIQLFEWQNSILHAKAMMVDKSWVTIGSYNLNFLSHYISIELNADIIDQKFAGEFSDHIENILRSNCTKIELDGFTKNNSRFDRFKMALAYIFHRTIMNVVMMARKHKKKKL